MCGTMQSITNQATVQFKYSNQRTVGQAMSASKIANPNFDERLMAAAGQLARMVQCPIFIADRPSSA